MFVRYRKLWIFGVLSIIGVAGYLVYTSRWVLPEGITIEPVVRGEVRAVVSETGAVTAAQTVDLAFERSGRVLEVRAPEGSVVTVGDPLIVLDAAQQSADLASARARLRGEEIRLEELIRGADGATQAVTESSVEAAETAVANAKRYLAEVTLQQDQLVASALKTLRSSALQAYLISGEREDTTNSYTAPTVSGTYASDSEGIYTISLYSSAAASGASYRVTGLESDTEQVSTVHPTPLGTRGLYIQFPTDFAPRTEWEVPIPNTRSSTYLTNLNAYNALREARSVALAGAENAVKAAEAAREQSRLQLMQISGSARDERIAAQRALVEQMQAAVSVAEVAYRAMTLTAPFSGIVTRVDAEVGEIVKPLTPTVSLVSSEKPELVVNISESDIEEITVGDTARVLLDAYKGLVLTAHVKSVAPNATIIDGVRVFEVRLAFDAENERIRPGLSADIDIEAAHTEQVLTVPSRAVVEKNGSKFVRALDGRKLVYIPIGTGLRGSEGMTEVVSGLTEGQPIITFALEAAIRQLEANEL